MMKSALITVSGTKLSIISLGIVSVFLVTGCERKPEQKIDQPPAVEAQVHAEKNTFSAQAVIAPLNITECRGQTCPEIKIQRLKSNYPELDQVIDRYIDQYVGSIVSGFDFDHISAKSQVVTQTGSPITTMNEQQQKDAKVSAVSQTIETTNNLILQSYIDKFLILADEVKSLGSSAQLNLYVKPQVLNPDSSVVTVVMNASHYIGGAHGSSAQQYLNFEVASKSILSLDQIIEQGKRKEFNDLAYAAYQTWIKQTQPDMDIKTYEELWKFTLSENFYLSPQGLILQYGEYDIGPYAVGLPRLVIPYTELTGILKVPYLPVIEKKVDDQKAEIQSKSDNTKS